MTDGRRGLRDPIVELLNILVAGLPYRLHYIDDSLAEAGRTIDHELEGEGDHLGSDTKSSGCEKGAYNLQMDKASDTPPSAAHVLRVTKNPGVVKCYVITAMPKPMKRNDVVRIAPAVTQIMNPFFFGLLSQFEGDTLRSTFSKAAGNSTIATLPINHRTGATKSYTAALDDGSALPAGVVIDAATGIISITAATVAVGLYTVKVVALDVLVPYTNREGEGTLILNVTA